MKKINCNSPGHLIGEQQDGRNHTDNPNTSVQKENTYYLADPGFTGGAPLRGGGALT